MKSPHDMIVKPIISEKSMSRISDKCYVFVVDKHATKTEIKIALEQIFDIQVEKVNTIQRLGKIKTQGRFSGRRPSTKKAYVTLKKDSKGIEFFDSMSQ